MFFKKYGHGLLNVGRGHAIFMQCLFLEAAKLLGGSLLKEWADKFGLGNFTDIDLTYEKKGMCQLPRLLPRL